MLSAARALQLAGAASNIQACAMQRNCPKLSPRHTSSDPAATGGAIDVLKQAIAQHLCVRASYNRDAFILAPHILCGKHREPYLDAVAIEPGGSRPTESTLGTFKLSGLRNVMMTSEPVITLSGFDPGEERYREQMIAAIET
jgi:hypothetical protein